MRFREDGAIVGIRGCRQNLTYDFVPIPGGVKLTGFDARSLTEFGIG